MANQTTSPDVPVARSANGQATFACGYHVRPGNALCGEPATHKNFTGAKYLYLCAAHAVQVQKATRGQCRPEPLGESDWVIRQGEIGQALAGARMAAETAALRAAPGTPAAAARPAPRASDLAFAEQLRRFREGLAAQGDAGTL